MNSEIHKLVPKDFPPLLREINDPPKELYLRGVLPPEDTILLCVVGSRKYTSYGKRACEHIIEGLAGTNITIVSGLALGIDSIAHRAALNAGLATIAVPGSGLDQKVLYPASHMRLAEEIVASGGALLSEFQPDFQATKWSFPKRNRIMAGMSHAVLIVEAEERSGTLITARLAMEYNRDVLAIPGQIFSPASYGTNILIRDGATPISSAEDILQVFGIKKLSEETAQNLSKEEQEIVTLLREPLTRDEITHALNIDTRELGILLSKMELAGIITERAGKIEVCR